MAGEWWNENGKFKPLHMMNPVRASYIVEKIKELKKCDLKELSLLDVGCGGGILSESMARVSINVVGIDVCKELQLFVSTRFQILFHSPPGVLFTFPSRYLFTIGR